MAPQWFPFLQSKLMFLFVVFYPEGKCLKEDFAKEHGIGHPCAVLNIGNPIDLDISSRLLKSIISPDSGASFSPPCNLKRVQFRSDIYYRQ